MIFMKRKIIRALSLMLTLAMLICATYSSMIVSSAAVNPATDTTPGNYIGLEYVGNKWVYYSSNKKIDKSYVGLAMNKSGKWYVKNGAVDFSYNGFFKDSDGLWYLKGGKVDTSRTGLVYHNSYGWIYLKNGKYDTSYNGMAYNSNGWWYVRGGRVDFNFTGLAYNAHGWWYFTAGRIDYSYNSLAQNQNGWWYIKKGTVDFSYNGSFTNNMGQWNVKKGKAVISKKTYPSVTTYEVDAKSVSAKAGTVVRAWRLQYNGLFIEIHRIKYGNQITQKFVHSQDSQVNIEKSVTYQPYINVAYMIVNDPTRLGMASSKTLLGVDKAYVDEMAKKANAVIAINGEANVYKNDHSTVRNGKVEKSSTTVSKTKFLHIYRDGTWQLKAMDNLNISAEIKAGLYNTLVSRQKLEIQNGIYNDSDRDKISDNQYYYSNRTFLGRINSYRYVLAMSEFMPIANAGKVLLAYGVSDATMLNGGNCSYMYVRNVGNTTGAIGKSLKNLSKIGTLETEFFGNNHMIGNNSQGYEMLGGPCQEPDIIYFK